MGVATFASGAAQAVAGYQGQMDQYSAQVASTDAQNRALANNYYRQKLQYELGNYNKVTQAKTNVVDYNIYKDESSTAAARAFAKNEAQIQQAFDSFKLAEQSGFVESRKAVRAFEGGSTTAGSLNALREAGRAQAARLNTLTRAQEAQYSANQEVLQEVNQRLNRAHDKVYKEVQFNELAPDRPIFLEAPPKPNALGLVAGLAGSALSAATAFNSFKAPSGIKPPATPTALPGGDQTFFNSAYESMFKPLTKPAG